MKIQLTDEQQAAVDASLCENLVSAAAGSGKTKVLSERITKKLRSGDTSIDRLLIVTFTRAAASQMRERIQDGLEEEYRVRKTKRLKKQLAMLSSADICTIDSFCIDLVKRYFYTVDIAPDFNVADENEMVILREEVVLEVLDEMYGEGSENFLKLAKSMGKGKNDNALKDMILKVYSFCTAFEEPDEWLDYALLNHDKESAGNEALFEAMGKEIEEQLSDFRKMLYENKHTAEDWGVDAYVSVFESECMDFEKYLNVATDKISEGFELFTFGSFSGKKVDASLGFEKEYLQERHNEAKKVFGKIKEFYGFYRSEKGVSYPKIEALVRSVKKFRQKYMAEKFLRKELEFSDCEYLALKILKLNKDACEEIRKKYEEIYIDEYQDTNPLQDALFTLCSRKEWGEPNLFIVGDVKQSIYRFRHSDPTLFADKAKVFGSDDKSRKMILSKNFRSREAVLESINCVFDRVMRENTAQVEYDEEHRLKCGAKFVEYNKNKSELYILSGKYENEVDEELAREQQETLVAAQIVRKMMDEGFKVSDGGKMRNMKYSDVAVLSRTITGKADMITGAFSLMGVPSVCDAAINFFDSLEINLIISLLKAVDNPLCDIPLAALMRSAIFSFTENELVQIRNTGRKLAFYENVRLMSENDTPLGKKCVDFIETLTAWREKSGVMSVERLITNIIDESGYYSFVGALPGGEMRQSNLKSFINLAASYEKLQYRGLYNFIRYVDKTIESGGSVGSEIAHSDNAVLVTSIHKSKGLEFPIVILIGCGAKFNDRDSVDSLILSPKGGIGIVETDSDRRIKYKMPEYKAISMMITRESHAEQMRLLYVAMTRAKEKLILIGTDKNYVNNIPRWEMFQKGRRMSDYAIRSITNYLEYVVNSISDAWWDVTYIDALPELCEKAEEESVEKSGHKVNEEIVKKLSYMYPYDAQRNIPSKMSVSEIKKMSMENEESVEWFPGEEKKRVPRFMEKEERLTGAKRGTAYHRVMELIDLNETDVKKALESFVKKGYMSPKEADCVDIKKIEGFLKSPLCERMKMARRIWKEESFTIAIDARDVFEEGEDEKICVQGTIDCLFEDCDGKLVLLDYKTDFYTDPEDIGKRYKKQLELYEVAVFMKFSRSCDEKCLYLFHNDDIIEV